MANQKKLLLSSIVKAIVRLSKLEKQSHNPHIKKEIQDEISNLVFVLTSLDDFVSFLLDKLQTELQIRADERLTISLEKMRERKTGPLGNPIEEKLKKIGNVILEEDEDESVQ